MNGDGKRILLIEDNERILSGNKWMFEQQGFETATALTLAEARLLLHEREPDVIVLDIMLPDGSGLDFMRELRESENAGIPILLLTGLTTKEDVVRGLTAGGDDYLTKPYDFSELLARAAALLRRSARMPNRLAKGPLTIDIIAMQAHIGGGDLNLTHKECGLLLLLALNEEKILSAEDLYKIVWGQELSNDRNALQTAASKLRKKIEPAGYTVATTRGMGYSFKRI
ncbi:MAG: response regulator transcription factor [Gracilibacteraceae bacterium]|jgi:DNA-binding response OmpR family regulator|nr:response regulator transcription factor [Gracilibacteraceae bacterium]